MNTILRTLSIICHLSILSGCESLDPIQKKVNSPKQFEAIYLFSESSQLGESLPQEIELITKQNKFYATYHEGSKVIKKLIYDGDILWQFIPKKYSNEKDTVLYKKANFGSIKNKVYFWRMPPGKNLPQPTEEELDGYSYYVYKYKDAGPSGHLSVTIYVDRDDFIVKEFHSQFFLKDDLTPFTEWKLECTDITFRNDISDNAFEFTPPPETEVMTFGEAGKKGMEALQDIL